MTPTEIKEALRRETAILGHHMWASIYFLHDGSENIRCIIFRDAAHVGEIIYFNTIAEFEAFLMFEPELSEPLQCNRPCPRCRSRKCVYEIKESSCGGYDDEKYRCKKCDYVWWVDGIDS